VGFKKTQQLLNKKWYLRGSCSQLKIVLPENSWIWGTLYLASQVILYTSMVVKVIKTWMTLPRHVIRMGKIKIANKIFITGCFKNVDMNCYIRTHE